LHVHKIFFADHGLDHKAEIFGNGIAVALANNLAGVLNREFNFQVLIPIGVYLKPAFTDPFGIIFVNIFNFKVVRDVELFQSGPD
jgi:hypothetical protein